MSGATAIPRSVRCIVYRDDNPIGIVVLDVREDAFPLLIRITPAGLDEDAPTGWIAERLDDPDGDAPSYHVQDVDDYAKVRAWDAHAAGKP